MLCSFLLTNVSYIGVPEFPHSSICTSSHQCEPPCFIVFATLTPNVCIHIMYNIFGQTLYIRFFVTTLVSTLHFYIIISECKGLIVCLFSGKPQQVASSQDKTQEENSNFNYIH